jgi:hypothetical protein
MTSKQDLFNLFFQNTGRSTYIPNRGESGIATPWQESRVKEFAFMDPVDVG